MVHLFIFNNSGRLVIVTLYMFGKINFTVDWRRSRASSPWGGC